MATMTTTEPEIEQVCDNLRVSLKGLGVNVKGLMNHSRFDRTSNYEGQHSEMRANIMLAYRHLEDARMRVGKILQAAGDGVSILDK